MKKMFYVIILFCTTQARSMQFSDGFCVASSVYGRDGLYRIVYKQYPVKEVIGMDPRYFEALDTCRQGPFGQIATMLVPKSNCKCNGRSSLQQSTQTKKKCQADPMEIEPSQLVGKYDSYFHCNGLTGKNG